MRIFTRAIAFINAIGIIFSGVLASADWTVDFSRRAEQMGSYQVESSPSVADKSEGFIDSFFKNTLPTEEVVVLNTAQGFVPSTIRLRVGVQYRFIVVNVNESARNISFVMDAFSEHHSTYYGKLKSFFVTPKKEGVYSFVSPETSAQGRLVVKPSKHPDSNVELRAPASLGE